MWKGRVVDEWIRVVWGCEWVKQSILVNCDYLFAILFVILFIP